MKFYGNIAGRAGFKIRNSRRGLETGLIGQALISNYSITLSRFCRKLFENVC